jgi:hypothetical protein
MMLRLSDHEASILLGATLMHWGVPFRFADKRALTEQQQVIVDQAAEKLIAVRGTPQTPPLEEIDLSETEIALLAEVVDNCLEECGSDAVELRLQLNAGERREVEALLERLRFRQPVHN